MSYNPHGFCRGLEGAIQSMAMAAANSATAEREIDRSGPVAVARLSGALRAERRRSARLEAELLDLYKQTELLNLEITLLRRGHL